MGLISWIILLIILIIIAIALFAWFYQRATSEIALLRTGIGGRKVVIDGGVIALPYFHEISRINMQTLRLDIDRRNEASLITQDRLRVDVGAEFYVSVIPDMAAVNRASQTLGKRTFQRDELRALLDGMMVDALRSVAARMTMDDLHENRAQFVHEVREMLADTLSRYGLELDSVSLTSLDQTPFDELDENNAFNAVGMRRLAEVVATSKKERAEIDATSEVSVRKAAMLATRERLDIELEEKRAEIAQQQEIETLAAAQLAEIARRKADCELSATQARINMERSIEKAEIERSQSLDLAEQERNIVIAGKVLEETQAQIEADRARAEATIAEQSIETAKATTEAKRRAELTRIAAEADAEASSTRKRIEARTQRETAEHLADAQRVAAETDKIEKLNHAEINRAQIEAENTRSESMIGMEIEKARLEALPKLASELVKPAEKIKSININQLSGLRSSADSVAKPVVNQALDSILDMAVQMPAMKKIGKQVGINLEEGMADLTENRSKKGDDTGKD